LGCGRRTTPRSATGAGTPRSGSRWRWPSNAPAEAAGDRATPAEPTIEEARTMLPDVDQMLLEVAALLARVEALLALES
jgi:hypothetical protein